MRQPNPWRAHGIEAAVRLRYHDGTASFLLVKGDGVAHIRSRFATIAFGLLVPLLGHDALMAASPRLPTHATSHESSESAIEVDCGPTTGVNPQATDDSGIDDTSVVRIVPGVTQGIAGFLPHWSVEPGHPPAVKRALLQVYLN